MINFINLAKSSLVLPAAVSSFWLVDVGQVFGPGEADQQELLVTTFNPHRDVNREFDEDPNLIFDSNDGSIEAQGAIPESNVPEQVALNRARIERILSALNRVAEVSMQMEPERASQLEPVILDLAEQAMALSTQEIAIQASTFSDLEKIETTVKRLSHAVATSIEPELQL